MMEYKSKDKPLQQEQCATASHLIVWAAHHHHPGCGVPLLGVLREGMFQLLLQPPPLLCLTLQSPPEGVLPLVHHLHAVTQGGQDAGSGGLGSHVGLRSFNIPVLFSFFIYRLLIEYGLAIVIPHSLHHGSWVIYDCNFVIFNQLILLFLLQLLPCLYGITVPQ